MKPPVKMLMIFVDETDTWDDIPLYEGIVRRLKQLEVAGATVQTGIMGFGSHMSIHKKGLFGVTDDRPVVITVVDSAEKLQRVVPEIRSMVREGLVILTDVEVIP